jgi:hypothetical protein
MTDAIRNGLRLVGAKADKPTKSARSKARSVPIRWRDAIRDDPSLKSAPKLIALILSTYMSNAGVARPGLQTLARGASQSKSTVALALDELEERGYIERDRSRGGTNPKGRGHTTGYRARFPEQLSVTGQLERRQLSAQRTPNCPIQRGQLSD